MLRAVLVTFPRGAATQRLTSATGWGGQASAAVADAMFEEMLRMPPLAASQAEVEDWRFTGALASGTSSRALRRHCACRRTRTTSWAGQLGVWRAARLRAVCGRCADGMPLRDGRQALGGDAPPVCHPPRGPDWSRTTELVLAHVAAAELAEVAALGVCPDDWHQRPDAKRGARQADAYVCESATLGRSGWNVSVGGVRRGWPRAAVTARQARDSGRPRRRLSPSGRAPPPASPIVRPTLDAAVGAPNEGPPGAAPSRQGKLWDIRHGSPQG